jgi:hypothetical protein
MFYAQTPGFPNYFFKGVNVLPANIKVVEAAMRQIENMLVLDPMCRSARTIKHLDADHHIYCATFAMCVLFMPSLPLHSAMHTHTALPASHYARSPSPLHCATAHGPVAPCLCVDPLAAARDALSSVVCCACRPPMVSNRDFVWYSVDYTLPDGTFVTTGKSMITADCPEDPKFVRGEIRASGYICEPIVPKDGALAESKETRLTYIVQVCRSPCRLTACSCPLCRT